MSDYQSYHHRYLQPKNNEINKNNAQSAQHDTKIPYFLPQSGHHIVPDEYV
jgi:hypothetical protein